MKLITARQAWHDAYHIKRPSVLEKIQETLEYGTFIQETNYSNNLNLIMNEAIAGKIQNEIQKLPGPLKSLGNVLYAPTGFFTDDDSEFAHECIKNGLLAEYAGQQWTDEKLDTAHYLVYAAMIDYKRMVVNGACRLKPSQIRKFLNDEYEKVISKGNWHRDYSHVYSVILNVIDSLDKRLLKPVADIVYKDQKHKKVA